MAEAAALGGRFPRALAMRAGGLARLSPSDTALRSRGRRRASRALSLRRASAKAVRRPSANPPKATRAPTVVVRNTLSRLTPDPPLSGSAAGVGGAAGASATSGGGEAAATFGDWGAVGLAAGEAVLGASPTATGGGTTVSVAALAAGALVTILGPRLGSGAGGLLAEEAAFGTSAAAGGMAGATAAGAGGGTAATLGGGGGCDGVACGGAAGAGLPGPSSANGSQTGGGSEGNSSGIGLPRGGPNPCWLNPGGATATGGNDGCPPAIPGAPFTKMPSMPSI